ncbi:MAG: hypothetical protein LBS68_01230 [Puniceicoccales bacterium]|jgi:hypothetical protein|nr:hypothetical protein [Puniceicoccales bacterium]
MEAAPFLVGTGAIGLPRSSLPPAATGMEILRDIDPSTATEIYWLLRSLEISYAYFIGGVGTFSAAYAIAVEGDPAERLLQPAIFSRESEDPESGAVSFFDFRPGEVRLQGNGLCAYDLHLLETDRPYREVELTLEPTAAMDLLDSAEISLFGKTIPIYLQADPALLLSGSISSAAIVPSFWQFASAVN